MFGALAQDGIFVVPNTRPDDRAIRFQQVVDHHDGNRGVKEIKLSLGRGGTMQTGLQFSKGFGLAFRQSNNFRRARCLRSRSGRAPVRGIVLRWVLHPGSTIRRRRRTSCIRMPSHFHSAAQSFRSPN